MVELWDKIKYAGLHKQVPLLLVEWHWLHGLPGANDISIASCSGIPIKYWKEMNIYIYDLSFNLVVRGTFYFIHCLSWGNHSWHYSTSQGRNLISKREPSFWVRELELQVSCVRVEWSVERISAWPVSILNIHWGNAWHAQLDFKPKVDRTDSSSETVRPCSDIFLPPLSDWETVDCFLIFHDINKSQKIQYPIKDFREWCLCIWQFQHWNKVFDDPYFLHIYKAGSDCNGERVNNLSMLQPLRSGLGRSIPLDFIKPSIRKEMKNTIFVSIEFKVEILILLKAQTYKFW